MKKVLENYGGIILFYAVIIIATLILCSPNCYLEKTDENHFYTAQITRD